MKTAYLFAFLGLLAPPAFAQTVSTLAALGVDGDGITVAPDGDLYVAGGGPTTVVLKVTPTGEVSTFVPDVPSPVGIDMDSEGNFFVANYSANTVSKISPAGEVSTFGTGMNGPAGVAVNAADEVFFAEFGAGFSGTGRAVRKFSKDGVKQTYLEGNGLQDPVGIAIDERQNVYVANWNSGEIYRSDGTTVTRFAQIGGRVNQITYANGYLYVPSPNLRKIFRVDAAGRVEHIAGTGASGAADGPVLAATFVRPNGIAMAPDGRRLYIVDAGMQAIRVLDLETGTGVEDDARDGAQPTGFVLRQNYPNPFNPTTNISFTLGRPAHVTLTVADLLGREVAVLVDEPRAAGVYTVAFDASALASGLYLYRLRTGAYAAARLLAVAR